MKHPTIAATVITSAIAAVAAPALAHPGHPVPDMPLGHDFAHLALAAAAVLAAVLVAMVAARRRDEG